MMNMVLFKLLQKYGYSNNKEIYHEISDLRYYCDEEPLCFYFKILVLRWNIFF